MLIFSGPEPCCLSYRDQTLEVPSTETDALCLGKLYSVKAVTKKGEKFAVIKKKSNSTLEHIPAKLKNE